MIMATHSIPKLIFFFAELLSSAAAAAAKLLQSCPTLCDPIDISTPGSPVPGILQAPERLSTQGFRLFHTHTTIYFPLPSDLYFCCSELPPDPSFWSQVILAFTVSTIPGDF